MAQIKSVWCPLWPSERRESGHRGASALCTISGYHSLASLMGIHRDANPFASRHRPFDRQGGDQVQAGLLGCGVDGRLAFDQVVEPSSRLVRERPPEITHRPVAGSVAAEKRHVDSMIGHIGVGNAVVGIE